MNTEILDIAYGYITLEWARKTVEHDLRVLKSCGLKFPQLYEETAVKVLDQLSKEMRRMKQEMMEKNIKVVHVGNQKKPYPAIVYDVFADKKQHRIEMSPDALRNHVFDLLERMEKPRGK